MKLGIIGTAFRKEDYKQLTADKFFTMIFMAKSFITDSRRTGYDIRQVISGGSAGADFVAVSLFLDKYIEELKLFLPCDFDLNKCKFVDTKERNYIKNPGGTLNYYHKKFNEICKTDSFKMTKDAILLGAKTETIFGLKERNTKVAETSELLLSMTFGNEKFVKDGGTADTVRKFLNLHPGNIEFSWHLDLNTMKIHQYAEPE